MQIRGGVLKGGIKFASVSRVGGRPGGSGIELLRAYCYKRSGVSVNKFELPEIPPDLEEQRVVIGDEAMQLVKALYYANIVFFVASDSLAKEKRKDAVYRGKMELRVRTAEKLHLRVKHQLEQFWIPPSAQAVIDKYCSPKPIDLG
jgi:hypothetical protein